MSTPSIPSTLITGIGSLVTNDPAHGTGPLGLLTDAAVVIDGSAVAWVGPAAEAPAADERFDAAGRALLPGYVDSHAHLVFAGDRTAEFNARMSGQSYSAGGSAPRSPPPGPPPTPSSTPTWPGWCGSPSARAPRRSSASPGTG